MLLLLSSKHIRSQTQKCWAAHSLCHTQVCDWKISSCVDDEQRIFPCCMFLKNSLHHIFTAFKTLFLNNTFVFRSRKTVKNNKKTNLSLQNLSLSLHSTVSILEFLLALRVRLHETCKINLALRVTRIQNIALLFSLTFLLFSSFNFTFLETSFIAFLTHHFFAVILDLTFILSSFTFVKPLIIHVVFALS